MRITSPLFIPATFKSQSAFDVKISVIEASFSDVVDTRLLTGVIDFYRLKIVSEILRRHEPLIGVVLWVAGDHVADLRGACLKVFGGNTDSIHRVSRAVWTKLGYLFTAILAKFAHVVLQNVGDS